MATPTNRQIRLARRPEGFPKPGDFRLASEPVADLQAGQLLVRVAYLSVDPYMRGRMSDAKSYVPPIPLDGVMGGFAVGKVVESKNPAFAAGTYVGADFGWQEYAISDGKGLRTIDPAVAPLTTALGVLGMTGMTAYFGLLHVGEAKAGQTVVVSGAAGAVGSVVGQIAKIKGCKVVGSAGTDDKVEYLTKELGFDAAFNYKTTRDLTAELRELAPAGIDVYFDNVGGTFTDAVIPLLNVHARVTVCGQISQYNLEKPELGPRWLHQLIVKRARFEGMLISDFAPHFPEALRNLTGWYREGKLKFAEQVATGGIEAAPAAFIGMLHGQNLGKQLVQISDA